MPKSNYLENKYLDWLMRQGTAFTPNTTWYLALYTVTPGPAGGGSEVTGGSYARAPTTASMSNWSATNSTVSTANPSTGTSGQTVNIGSITFPAPTANWGVVTHTAIWDAVSGGNMLYYSALNTPKTINNGDAAPNFAPGSITITET